MKKTFFLVYGVVCYLSFLVAILYMIGFLGNFLVPKSIDSGEVGIMGGTIMVNVLLMALFAVQHTIMARPAFKDVWTKIVPKPIERATFVLVTSAILLLIFWQWRPIPSEDLPVWNVEAAWARAVIYGVFALGWVLVFYSSFMIDHFELFGLRQVVTFWQGKESTPSTFRTPVLYRWVRNPLMLGFLLTFWATPDMSAGHALFAVVMTVYIFVGIQIEERDIGNALGDEYRRYRSRTSMIIPLPPKRGE